MSSNFLDDNLDRLELSSEVKNILNKNNIFKIKDLCCLSKSNLKDFGIDDGDIKHLAIILQLNGLDLNKKIKKN
jgi:Leucine-rich repeat (LRR) protein